MSKHNRWLRAAAAIIAGAWVIVLAPMPSALAGTSSVSAPTLTTTISGTTFYKITSAGQLEYIDQNQTATWLSANYLLMNNIQLSGYNWTPFGNSSTAYSGTFNGNGYTVSGWSVNTSATDAGFFGRTSGIIENVGVEGDVHTTHINGITGGLVGIQQTGTIQNSYATGSVGSATTQDAGGLVGSQIGTIQNSYATGSVGGVWAGGLVGSQSGTIQNSYATGSVSGGPAGGLVGSQSGTIENSYATGRVSGAPAGGLVGSLDIGSISHSYFDTSTTEQQYSIGTSSSTTGAELTTWMQTPLNFTNAGWKSPTSWALYTGQYPLLAWQVPLAISSSASPTTVGTGGTVTVTGSVYSSGGSPLSGVNVTLSDGSAGGSWVNSSVTTDTSGNFTGTWTAPNTPTTATVTASVYGTNHPIVQQQSTIQVQAFTVTFNSNGGSAVASETVPYNGTATSPTNPTKTGYTFAGWYSNSGLTTPYKFSTSVTGSETLYAKWTANNYTVAFNSNGGSAVASETVAYNGTATQPTNPTKTGYTFAGWYSDSGLTTPYTFTTPVTGSETLYAKWTVNVHSGPVPPSIITNFFPEPAQVGQAYSAQVREIGGVDPMKWTITSGTLSPGLTLSNQGVISGTPTSAGNYTFTVKVTDANSLSSSKQLTLTVNSTASTGSGPSTPATPVSVTTNNEQAATMGQPYHQTLQATGGQTPYTWSIVGGVLPAGLSLNPKTGVISGTPSQTGVFHVTAQAKGADGTTSNKTITIDLLKSDQREVLWNGAVKNVPAIVQKEGTTPTTYMPIWYVMQLLKPMGITNTWDGKHWHMTTSNTPDLSNIQAGHGNTGIYLNGMLVQNVNTVAATDPSTNKPTTYMAIWYVMQLLKRVGLQSTWNGTTWTVTK